MKRYDVQIELTVAGPLLTASSEPGDLGLDMIIARTDDCPYIPGTLLSGKLDQAWQEIEGAAPELFAANRAALLGERNENKEPLRKQLFFSDLNLTEQDVQKIQSEAVQHRVTIDKERGAASQQQLVAMESPFAQGDRFTFIGKVIFFAPEERGEEILHSLDVGLRWLSQLGGMRTIGYGRVAKAAVLESATKRAPLTWPDTVTITSLQAKAPTNHNKVCLRITPQYPFCLSKPQAADNLFESNEIISGAAVLGSIVTTWNNLCGSRGKTVTVLKDSERRELKENFNNLRISHAFPVHGAAPRPVALPKSLVKIAGEEEWYDVALADKPCLINKQVPDFAIDWKDDAAVKKDFGWLKLRRQLRVRTGIEPELLRAAENELFSQEQIIPDGHCWLATLDMNQVPEGEQDKVLVQFCSLISQGVFGLGKTKTPFMIECLEAEKGWQSTKPSHAEPLAGDLWIITLQTDTLLGSPEHLNESSGAEELRHMYAKAWQELSDGTLELVRYFASQHLSGGEWLRRTMQQDRKYRPWLLTDAGSVFVLRAAPGVESGSAGKHVQQWLRHGLPLKGDVRKYYDLDREGMEPWQCCPYLPEGGYGEIAVNLDVHTERYLAEHYDFIETIESTDTLTEEVEHA